MTDYEPVIGLEVHAQLSTQSKLFSRAPTQFGASPNKNITEVCVALPGVLPVLNEEAVGLAARAGFALGCTVHERSQWSRKNYFYPDLPKGYQITQFEHPICTGGSLEITVDGESRRIGITRIHIEEDAGKSVHEGAGGRSYVDFNRAGVPLVEIVSDPDVRSAKEAAEYMRTMRQLLRFIGVCDGNMEEGSLRCDANVSIRPRGREEFGTRCEIKNLNSFRFIQEAVEYEIDRQADVIDSGGTIVQETRLWDTNAKETRSMRSKEEAHDYRYFPEPDLPDLIVSQETLDAIKSAMPELPANKRARYQNELKIAEANATVLTEEPEIARFFEEALAEHDNAKAISNWVVNDVLREASEMGFEALKVTPVALAKMIKLIDDSVISGKIAKDVFAELVQHGGEPEAIVEAKGWKQVTDTSAIEPIVQKVLDANPNAVADLKEGKMKSVGFLVGQVMKETQGKANPKMVNQLIQKLSK